VRVFTYQVSATKTTGRMGTRKCGLPMPRFFWNGSASCPVADRWEQRHARAWWELHDPELTAP
jgi:hypothetical protein